MTRYLFAWSRLSPILKNPQGRLHAVDPETGQAACGRSHAGIFRPNMEYDYRHLYACRDCERIVTQ